MYKLLFILSIIKLYAWVNIFKTLVPKFFDKEKSVLHYENLKTFLENRIETKKMNRVLECNQSQGWKPCFEFNTIK